MPTETTPPFVPGSIDQTVVSSLSTPERRRAHDLDLNTSTRQEQPPLTQERRRAADTGSSGCHVTAAATIDGIEWPRRDRSSHRLPKRDDSCYDRGALFLL